MLYKVTFYGTSRADGKRYRVEFIVDARDDEDAKSEAMAWFSDLPRFHTPVWKVGGIGRIHMLDTREVPMPSPPEPPPIVSGDGEAGC